MRPAWAAKNSAAKCTPLPRAGRKKSWTSCCRWWITWSSTPWPSGERFGPKVRAWCRDNGREISCGLRINPEHSEGAVAIYNPCSPGSRLGIRPHQLPETLPEGISGLHFHTLCEQGSDALERTLDAVEARFGKQLAQCKWINFGGGHHITREGYDLDRLCRCITRMQQNYGAQIYLEPGEAVALNAGWLVVRCWTWCRPTCPSPSWTPRPPATCPTCWRCPTAPTCWPRKTASCAWRAKNGEKAWTCRLAGKSCLAGDVIGEYSFAAPLKAGDRLIFTDMVIYSMVKTTTFNGLRLPSIGSLAADLDAADPAATARFRLVRRFGYEDFKTRLS